MKSNSICIIGGAGHVGLPLAIAFAAKNIKTNIYDVNESALELIKKGSLPFKELGATAVLKKVINRTLFVSVDPRIISQAKYLIIVIGTPVDEFFNPRINEIFDFIKKYTRYFRAGQYLILRSTLYPGTTQKINEYFQKIKLPINLAFCPERIAEGKALEEIYNLPQIISAFNKPTAKQISKLFRCLTKDVIILQPLEAEIAKLFTNVWRYIQFAIPNQFLIIALKYGLDFFNIIDAIKFKYPRAKGFYGPGFAAGPCLLKDTMQLASFNNNDFMLGHAAMLVNEGLPKYMVDYLKRKYPLTKMTVGILGMAFKADNDDARSSLSYKLKKIVGLECKQVICTDVYIKDPSFDSVEVVCKKADLIIVAAPHLEYKNIKFGKNCKIFDIWNFYGKGLEF